MDSKVDLAKSYAMYSEEYAPDENNRLDQTKIKLIYEKETLKITKKATYMGIWQLFALATVLGRPIYSIYLQAGNQHVRKDLNRVILPQEQRETHTSYIMWTSTRFDMTERNWIPNHFVANQFRTKTTWRTRKTRSDLHKNTEMAIIEKEKTCKRHVKQTRN